jgi:hypothetical protein
MFIKKEREEGREERLKVGMEGKVNTLHFG